MEFCDEPDLPLAVLVSDGPRMAQRGPLSSRFRVESKPGPPLTDHPGRFNIWGTVIGAFVLAVGITGLNLADLAFWVPPVFNGVALLITVSVAVIVRREKRQAI